MNVYIVGSCGYIGRNLRSFFEKKKICAAGLSSWDLPGIDRETGSLSNEFHLPHDTKAVVYLAQSPHYREVPFMEWHLLNLNVVSAVKMANLCCEAGVKRFIYMSTGSVYQPSFLPLREDSPVRRDDGYALSKLHAEEALALFRPYLDLTIIRLFGAYGPGQADKLLPSLIERVALRRAVTIQRNPQRDDDVDGLKISLCFIGDLLEIVEKIIPETNLPLVNLAGDRAVSIRELATTIGELLGREPVFRIAEESRRGDLIADISLLRRTFNPEFKPLREGLVETLRQA